MKNAVLVFVVCFVMFGCVKRTISITSQPGGALVWVNEREVGRTPIAIRFLYYGEYDVRVEGDGQEPIMTTRWADSSSWDIPVLDLISETSSDKNVVIHWHFDLEERNDDPELLIRRASAIRDIAVRGE